MQDYATLLLVGWVGRAAKTTRCRSAPVFSALAERTTPVFFILRVHSFAVLEETVDFTVATASFAASQSGTAITKSDRALWLTARVPDAGVTQEGSHFTAIFIVSVSWCRVVVVLGTRRHDVTCDGGGRGLNQPSPITEPQVFVSKLLLSRCCSRRCRNETKGGLRLHWSQRWRYRWLWLRWLNGNGRRRWW